MDGEVKFKHIDHFISSKALIGEMFADVCRLDYVPSDVDGLAFFHKDSIYTAGRTPLSAFLKPYMIPEKLDVAVNKGYLLKKPSNYTTLENYLLKKQEQKKLRMNVSATSEEGVC